LCIELQIERKRGYRIKTLSNIQDGSSTIDAVFMPVRNAIRALFVKSLFLGNQNPKIYELFSV